MIVSEAAAVEIRRVRPEDAEAVAELNGQLGYPAGAERVRDRIEEIANVPTQAVFVACIDGQVIGWVDVAIALHLQSEPFALIGGLVVKDRLRGIGIGKRLCEAVELWTRAQGIRLLRVTSRSTRADAHRFYIRDGYTEVKTSCVFEKTL
jgi:GNAT superfamily N-acetyltransferase